jgi:hypothetical protein
LATLTSPFHREALLQPAEALRGPDAELSAAQVLDAVADGDDDIEIVVLE